MVKHLPYRYRDFAYAAAEASLAARDQGKFHAMHLRLIERSPALDRESLIRCAREVGLDVARFTADLDGLRHRKEIDADLALAEKMDLYTTPSFFINGIKLVGNRPIEQFRENIDRELAASGAKGGAR